MSSVHDRLFILTDERDAARFDAHLLRQEKEQLRQENERLRQTLRGLVDAVALDLPRYLDDAYAAALQALRDNP
jgi:primosomal protein N''